MILGIDEVGRGPWAGPLVVGAVVLGGTVIDGLTDSKKLTKKRREALNEAIYEHAEAIGLGWVHAEEIDAIGLSAALTLACKRSLEQISSPYHEIIIDGTVNFLKDTQKGKYVTTMKKADLLVPSVSAASIVAKVARDRWMKDQDAVYPGYHFARHVGYGTAIHAAAIGAHGLTPLHRRSFAPISRYEQHTIKQTTPMVQPLTTRDIGNRSESVAALWLTGQGFEVLDRNWRTKFCEIDIVALKNNIIFFIEVKHRRQANQGGGIATITAKKLQQMKFASEVYRHRTQWQKYDARLAVISTVADDPIIESWVEIQ